MKTIAIIQGRMDSSRLPGKVLKKLNGRSVLEHVVRRLKKVKEIDKIIVATSSKPSNDLIQEECWRQGIDCFRGREDDVLSRFYYLSKRYQPQCILRATGDNPLICPQNIATMINSHLKKKADITYTEQMPTGCGPGMCVLSLKAIIDSFNLGKSAFYKEHPDEYVLDNYDKYKFNILACMLKKKRPYYRLTIDTPDDLDLFKIIFKNFKSEKIIDLNKVIDFLDSHPEIAKINKEDFTVIISQPLFFPWIGFIDKFLDADLFVFYDSTQFLKRYFHNRNKIISPHGFQYIRVPVKYARGQDILEVEINKKIDWQNPLLKAIKFAYGSTKYFKRYYNILEEVILRREWESISDLNIELCLTILNILNIHIPFIRSSDLGLPSLRATADLVQICKKVGARVYLSGKFGKDYLEKKLFNDENIRIKYQDFKHPTYKQKRVKKFESELSVIDLLFNLGNIEAKRIIVNNHRPPTN